MSPRYKAENEGPCTATEREQAIRLAGWAQWVSGSGRYVLTWTRGAETKIFDGRSYDKAIHTSFEGLAEAGLLTVVTPDVTSLQERLEAFAELLRPVAAQVQLQVPRFVYVEEYFDRSFESEGWLCREHAQAFTAKYGGLIESNPYSPSLSYACCCDVCGRALGPFTFTEDGVLSELNHWEESILSPIPEQYWELLRLVEAVLYSGAVEIRERVAALQDSLGVGA